MRYRFRYLRVAQMGIEFPALPAGEGVRHVYVVWRPVILPGQELATGGEGHLVAGVGNGTRSTFRRAMSQTYMVPCCGQVA